MTQNGHTKTCTQVFITASFILTSNRQGQQSSSAAQQINKLECLFSRIYGSNVKELPIAATADLNLKTIMLPERSSTDKTVLFHLYEILEKGNRIYHKRKKINDHLDLRVGGKQWKEKKHEDIGGVMEILIVAVVTQWYTFF